MLDVDIARRLDVLLGRIPKTSLTPSFARQRTISSATSSGLLTARLTQNGGSGHRPLGPLAAGH